MSGDVLRRFLGKGLIDVGGDDDKLGRLRQTAGDLSGILKKTPVKASPFALVAFDPDTPATDPTIAEVEKALRKRWQTYVNTFAETPVTVFRAMLLDALIRACGDNDTVAVAFVASARNVLPFMEVGGEREIWAEIVGEIEGKVEARAEREWATPASISVPAIEFESPSGAEIHISSKKVSRNGLAQKLLAAAGPISVAPNEGKVRTNGNPHWSQDTSGQWVYEFGTRTAVAVCEAINQAIGSLSVEGVDLPRITEDMTKVMSGHLTTTLQAVSGAMAGLQRRTHLLWWKEALFSPSARMSYRDMSTFDAAALMAFDMHRQVLTLSPASVAAFLRETVIALPTIDQEQKAPIRELVEKTRDAGILADLRTEAGKLVTAPKGRGLVLALIGHPDAVPQIDDRRFRDLVGVKPDTALTGICCSGAVPDQTMSCGSPAPTRLRDGRLSQAFCAGNRIQSHPFPTAHVQSQWTNAGAAPPGLQAGQRPSQGLCDDRCSRRMVPEMGGQARCPGCRGAPMGRGTCRRLPADREALSGPEMGVARTGLRLLARRLADELRGRPVAFVWTKTDISIPEDTKNAVRSTVLKAMPNAVEFAVSIKSDPVSAFPSPCRVWKALETWVAENTYPQDQDGDMLLVLDDATSGTNAVEKWRTAILQGLAVATRSRESSFPKAFWRWLQIRPDIVAAVFRHVPAKAEVEERLVAATPRNLDETAAETLGTLALPRGWLRLHGAVLSASCSPSDAARGGRSRSIPIRCSSKVCGRLSDMRSRRNSSSAPWRSKTRACRSLPVKLSPKIGGYWPRSISRRSRRKRSGARLSPSTASAGGDRPTLRLRFIRYSTVCWAAAWRTHR